MSAVIAGLILLPIFFLFLLFCALLLLNQSVAIREKLSLWPVIPLSFIMRFFCTSSDTFEARLHQKWGSRPEGFRGFRMHWGLGDAEWGVLQMQKREQYNLHIQQHEIASLHFAHPPCCSWQRGSTCPSGIPQPQSFPAASTSEYCIPSSLFIDIPACRHRQSRFSRLIIWLTSKLGTQLLLLLKDKKGQQDKCCFACL